MLSQDTTQQRTPTPWHSWSKCLKHPFRSFYPKVQHNQQRTPTPWHSWSKCLKPPFRSFYPKVQHNQQRTPTPWHSWSKCLKHPFKSFYTKVQHKYSQKHYHQILISKYLTQNMFLKHYLKKTWGEQGNLLDCSSL